MVKRVLLFLATNLLVIATLTVITSSLGLHGYLTAHGLDYTQLAIFCGLWGMGASLISLLLSKIIAKMAMGVVIINPRTATKDEHFLLDLVQQLAKRAGLTTVPQVGIYHSPEQNAFATGPSSSHALIAVSSGLLSGMNHDEIEGVLAHEMTHIANGDMVTMTLLQGVINAFALFFSRLLAYAVSIALSRSDDRSDAFSYLTYYVCTFVFDILFTLFGSILVAAYSRYREYRADLGGARLAGTGNMIAALQRLNATSSLEDDRAPSLAAFKIANHGSWLALFSTHPPLEKRIARLYASSHKRA